MTIEIPIAVEEGLRDLAAQQGREIGVLVGEVLQDYIEVAYLTDVTSAQVGETQLALIGELKGIPEWKDGSE